MDSIKDRICQIEKISGINIKDWLSKRGQNQVIKDHIIEEKDMQQYCVLKSLRELQPNDSKREKICLYFLHSKYPHNIIVSSLCNMSRYPIKNYKENKAFKSTLRNFEDMYEVPRLSYELNKMLVGCIEEYKNGKLTFDRFSNVVTSVVTQTEELYEDAMENFQKNYIASFREEDIEIISDIEEAI